MPDGGRAVRIVPTDVGHLYDLARVLRPLDRVEIETAGVSVNRALYRAFRNSILVRTAFVGDDIAAIWGLCVGMRSGVSPLSDLAVPWLHTSDAIERVPVSFLRIARQQLDEMKRNRCRLESFVAADYKQAVKLLRKLGFTVEPPAPIGVRAAPFCRFHMGFDS
jgi:hypothetical protein